MSLSDSDIIQESRDMRQEARRGWDPYIRVSNEDFKYFLGDQWNMRDKNYLKSQGRNCLVFNRIHRNIKMVSGVERKTRHSLVARPVEETDEETADILSASLLWSANADNMMATRSEAFEGSLITGANLLKFSLDYSLDPQGDVKLDRLSHNQFLLDPNFSRRDLSDCQYILERYVMRKEQAMVLLPKRASDIAKVQSKGSAGHFAGTSKSKGGDLITWDEDWVRTTVKRKVLIDQKLGEQHLIPEGRDLADIDKLLSNFPHLTVKTQYIPTVERRILIEGIPFSVEEDPLKIRDLPHTAILCFFHPEYEDSFRDLGGTLNNPDYGNFFRKESVTDSSLRLQGLVRCMKDPQTEVNKTRSQLLDWQQSKINTGFIVKNGAVVNVDDLYQSGQGKTIWVDDQSSMDDVRERMIQDLPPGFFQMKEMMDKDLVEIPGITDELLGIPEEGSGQMSGLLARLRQGAGLTTLRDIFDNYSHALKILGEKHLKIMVNNWKAEKFERITNKPATKALEERSLKRFDIVVEEAPDAATQKALAFQQAMQAKALGFDIPDSYAIDMMMIENKTELRKALEANEQLRSQQAQLEMEDRRMLHQLQRAKVFGDIGLGVERIARSEADRGLARERISELQENQAQAQLARIKAIKEIEAMETDQLIKLIQLTKGIEERQIQEAEQIQKQQEARGEADFQRVTEFVLGEQNGQNEAAL